MTIEEVIRSWRELPVLERSEVSKQLSQLLEAAEMEKEIADDSQSMSEGLHSEPGSQADATSHYYHCGDFNSDDTVQLIQKHELQPNLIFTSPPYNLGVDYGCDFDDKKPVRKYVQFLHNFIDNCDTLLKDGGRFVINIRDITIGKGRRLPIIVPLYGYLCGEKGYTYRGMHLWYKGREESSFAWGCYDDQTRVMTRFGLKFFKDLKPDDSIATLNPNTKCVEYNIPNKIFNYEYSDELYYVKNRGLDFAVTPNHNMALWNRQKKSIEMREISHCPDNIIIPQTHNGLPDSVPDILYFTLPSVVLRKTTKPPIDIDMDDWLSFLGIFFTDGGVYHSEKNRCYNVSIYQSKPKFIEKIKNLLDRLPFKYNFKPQKNEWVISSKQLSSFLIQFKNKNHREIPQFIHFASKRQKGLFFEWLMIGDGCDRKNSGGNPYLAVASDEFTNSLCSILVDIGKTFSITKQKAKTRLYKGKVFKSNLTINRINIKKAENYYVNLPSSLTRKQYSGNVYCVNINNHIIMTERNGKFAWCGNSWLKSVQPAIIDLYEYVFVFQKGEYPPGEDNLYKTEFIEDVIGVWKIRPVKKIFGKKKKNITKHPCPFPPELAKRVIKLYSHVGDCVLDPFAGVFNTSCAAADAGRNSIAVELNRDYCNVGVEKFRRLFMDIMFKKIVMKELIT